MDNPRRPSPRPRPATDVHAPAVARFVPDRRYTALAAGGAIGAVVAIFVTTDAAGRVLLAVTAVLLLGYVASDLVFSPRVLASSAGIVIKAPLVRARLRWDEVDDVRAETRFRRGLRSTTLEIDAGGTLAVFSKRVLGAEPMEAAALIEAFRPRQATPGAPAP